MTMTNEIPVHVEREMGSDGEPTGKYVFVVGELHHYYEPNFDAGRMQRRLVNAGYEFHEFLPIINEMQRQYDELSDEQILAAAKKSTGKKPPAEEPAE